MSIPFRLVLALGALLSILWPQQAQAALPAPPLRLQAETPTPAAEPKRASAVASVAWSPDGDSIALGGGFGIELYDSNLHPAVDLSGAVEAVTDLAWSPDSARLASAEAAQRVSVWDVGARQRVAHLEGFTAPIESVAWSPDGRWIAASSRDGRVLLWDARSFALQASLPYSGSRFIEALAWHPDSGLLAGAEMGALVVWDVAQRQQVVRISTGAYSYRSLAWTPDGRALVLPGARRWEVATGQSTPLSDMCSDGTATSAALSPDGQTLAAGGFSATAAVGCIDRLDSRGRRSARVLLQKPAWFEGPAALAWSPAGDRLVSTTTDGWLHLWEASDGALTATALAPGARLATLESLVARCVPNDSYELGLTGRLARGDYAGFVARVRTLPERALSPICRSHLAAVGEALLLKPLSPSPEDTAALPLTVEPRCSPNPARTRVWLVHNPNPYDVLVAWRWQDQARPSAPSFAVPAGTQAEPGAWQLITPAPDDDPTLWIGSGTFSATAVSDATECQAATPSATPTATSAPTDTRTPTPTDIATPSLTPSATPTLSTPSLTPTPATQADVRFDDRNRSLCRSEPGWLTVQGSVSLPPGQSQAMLQTSWYIVHPADLRTSQIYRLHGLLRDGDRFSALVFWPGIRTGDSVVEVHLGGMLLDPLTLNPIMRRGASLDYYWYPWVCSAPTGQPSAAPPP